jgi:hypothetical protein
MADLLTSSQKAETQAPSYYTNYLNNLASQGTSAAQNAQFVGAQPLQQKAFENVEQNVGNYQPTLQGAQGTLGQATNISPLNAANPYFQNANVDPSQLAQGYMNPYTQDVVNSIGTLGQRNIQQNLAPMATAGAVGSGQFGSQRGAQVLGQTIQNANTDILAQQNQALQAGYAQALTAAQKQQALEAQLGQTAGNLATSGQSNLINAATVGGNLAGQTQALGLGDVNALATYGGQQQQIAQNQQLFPLQTLGTSAGLLRGYQIPTTTVQTFQGSPLSAISSLGATAAALTQQSGGHYDSKGNWVPGSSVVGGLTDAAKNAYQWATDKWNGTTSSDAPTQASYDAAQQANQQANQQQTANEATNPSNESGGGYTPTVYQYDENGDLIQ